MHMKHLFYVPTTVASSKSMFFRENHFYMEAWLTGRLQRHRNLAETASRKWTKWDCHFQENTWTFVLILVFIFGLIAWEILFPHTGAEPRPPVSEAQGPNHREFPDLLFANTKIQVFDQRSEFWKTPWTASGGLKAPLMRELTRKTKAAK